MKLKRFTKLINLKILQIKKFFKYIQKKFKNKNLKGILQSKT